jgi:hypothetical protein
MNKIYPLLLCAIVLSCSNRDKATEKISNMSKAELEEYVLSFDSYDISPEIQLVINEKTNFISLVTKDQKGNRYQYDVMSDLREAHLSNTGKYMSVETGTNVIGRVCIINISNKKVLSNDVYQGILPYWSGEKVEYDKVIYHGSRYTILQHIIFNDGKYSNAEQTVGDYHGESLYPPPFSRSFDISNYPAIDETWLGYACDYINKRTKNYGQKILDAYYKHKQDRSMQSSDNYLNTIYRASLKIQPKEKWETKQQDRCDFYNGIYPFVYNQYINGEINKKDLNDFTEKYLKSLNIQKEALDWLFVS